MTEAMERVITTRIVAGFALSEYLNACYALQAIDITEFSSSKLLAFISDELSHFASHEQKLHQAKNLLSNSRNLLTPICALPAEILSRIFHFAVQNRPHTGPGFVTFFFPKQLESLSHVCSLWRRVALGSRSLWSHIIVAPRHPANARLLARAKVYAARARGSPLQIHIAKYANTPYHAPIEEQNLLEFLGSISHLIDSLELSAPLRNSEYYTEYLQRCLAGAVPGRLKRLEINNNGDLRSGTCPRIESSHDSPLSDDIPLDIPTQTLENLLLPVTVLSLRNTYIGWTSRVYYGLVELQLCCPVTKELSIPESDLYDILSASPALRVIVFDLSIEDPHQENSPVTPIVLEHLSILDIGRLKRRYLETMLQLLAPSKLSQLWINLGHPERVDSSFDDGVEEFFNRSHVSQLFIAQLGSLRLLGDIYRLIPDLDTLVLTHSNLEVASDGPVTRPRETHATPFHLHIYNSSISMPNLCRIVEEYHLCALTIWRGIIFPHEVSSNRISRAGLTIVLSPKCPSVNVLDDSELDPLRASSFAC